VVRPDDGTVDHLDRFAAPFGVVQRVKEKIPQPGQCPAPELAIDRRPFAEEIRQITPLRAGSGEPENAVENAPMIARMPPAVGAASRHERIEKSPLLITHQSPDQARLPPKAILNQISSPLGILFVNRT